MCSNTGTHNEAFFVYFPQKQYCSINFKSLWKQFQRNNCTPLLSHKNNKNYTVRIIDNSHIDPFRLFISCWYQFQIFMETISTKQLHSIIVMLYKNNKDYSVRISDNSHNIDSFIYILQVSISNLH